MNERIVKLITEADAYAWTISEKYVPECGEVNYLWEDAFRKKFAELIIERCIEQCWTVSELESSGYVVSECSKRVRKHFGIEQ